jgi:hypothetical protein
MVRSSAIWLNHDDGRAGNRFRSRWARRVRRQRKGFYVLTITNALTVGLGFLLEPGNIFHLLACLTVGGVWLLTRQAIWS